VNPNGLISGAFEVDLARNVVGAGAGLPAFAVIDHKDGRTGLMAIQARRGAPPRAQSIGLLMSSGIPGIMGPLAHGPARDAAGGESWFVICQGPPGSALLSSLHQTFEPWPERDLIEAVLRPVARALEELQSRHTVHRAINPTNMFQANRNEPVTLGCAWAAPPGSLQPAVFEPPYSAMCLPAGRGEGTIADDVYALGVSLIVLSLGYVPMAGLAPVEIARRKIELGSFNALVGDARLPQIIADLARGMLAEDPEHRPLPTLLADPAGARSRRVAARPPRRAQRPLEIAASDAWTARTLAFGIAADPEAGVRLLRTGAVDRWIRRSLGDGLLATRLDEALRLRASQGDGEDRREDAVLAMRAVALLDPLAPLCWSGFAFWPDGFGAALAEDEASGAMPGDAVADIIATEAMALWGAARPDRCDPMTLRIDAHQHRALLRQRGWGGGLERLRYALNPLLACRSPLVAPAIVARTAELLPALDRAAAQGRRGEMPMDRDLAAFIAARSEVRVDRELAQIGEGKRPEIVALAVLRLFAGLQARTRGPAVPALAAWIAEAAASSLNVFHGRANRERRGAALADLAGAGRLVALLGVIDDPDALATDRQGYEEALRAAQAIDGQLAAIDGDKAIRAQAARRMAQECVAGAGALALMLAMFFAMFA